MNAQRPLIVPWLVEQLNAERYPGVSWLNPEHTQFRVPWKHGSRQNITNEDFRLFEDWAIARGRFRPGRDQRTPSEWKRNFRSALNRKDGIHVIQDNSTDSEDPHKVFEIRLNTTCQNDYAQEAANARGGDEPPVLVTSTGAYGGSSSSSQDESMLSSLDLSSTTEALREENKACLPPPSLDPVPPTDTVSPLELHSGNNIFDTDFAVRVFYRGLLVSTSVFSNVRGLRFVPPGIPGCCPDLADVVLPDPAILNDKLQVSYTQRLLQGLAPGVILRIEGKTLCGARQGPCRVYWCHSEIPEEGMSHGELPKGHTGPIYQLQQFVQELIGYIEGRNGSPNYALWLCFGEQWPDSERPWKKKLIMVEVIPKALEALHELGKAQGASSLTRAEPDLRISDSLPQSHFLEHLRELEMKMEVQYGN
ncbi:interferon regulatory factor 3 isoform X2 [Varanus komodoensis]|uniref:interferon regulatory factor 3 isoform X2 n=1 Tax=Varanus komodoensis TaxID=61221 RepID=UPI001CF7D31B|nr:interferon regulatory factor 3 isoform X2 [Varanus komodoensis]